MPLHKGHFRLGRRLLHLFHLSRLRSQLLRVVHRSLHNRRVRKTVPSKRHPHTHPLLRTQLVHHPKGVVKRHPSSVRSPAPIVNSFFNPLVFLYPPRIMSGPSTFTSNPAAGKNSFSCTRYGASIISVVA